MVSSLVQAGVLTVTRASQPIQNSIFLYCITDTCEADPAFFLPPNASNLFFDAVASKLSSFRNT